MKKLSLGLALYWMVNPSFASTAASDGHLYLKVFGESGSEHIVVKTRDSDGTQEFSFETCSDLNERNCRSATPTAWFKKTDLEKKYNKCLDAAKEDYAGQAFVSLPMVPALMFAAIAVRVGAAGPVLARVAAACQFIMPTAFVEAYASLGARAEDEIRKANALKAFAKKYGCNNIRLDMPFPAYEAKLQQVLKEGCSDRDFPIGVPERSH